MKMGFREDLEQALAVEWADGEEDEDVEDD